MPRTRRQLKRNSPIIETIENQPKKKRIATKLKTKATDESSSESDIENYLKPASEIDFDSTFFKTTVVEKASFEDIENDIFSGINRLSDSESSDDLERNEHIHNTDSIPGSSGMKPSSRSVINFDHIHAYSKKLEEAKKQIEAYKAKQETKEKDVDILNMLTVGESKSDDINIHSSSIYSSEYETVSDSEKEDWEEVHTVEESPLIPKTGLQITVEFQEKARKKKGVDLMDVIKRRLNRIKKENQVFVHKVHLLCWIAHGNYVNKALSSENLMSLCLSLLPSQQCYPPKRLNLAYIEDILQWYRKTIKVKTHPVDIVEDTMENLFQQQIAKKECYDYRMFVYMFACIIRSLGIKCRLVLSLQTEPLRPPSSELCSLSKISTDNAQAKDKKSANISVLHNRVKTPTRSSKKTEIPTVVSTKKTKKAIERRNSSKPKNADIFKRVNVEDTCMSLRKTDNKTALDKDDKQTKKTLSLSLKKKQNKIVRNLNSHGTSSDQQSKTHVDKKGICKSGKENESVSSTITIEKQTKSKKDHSNNLGESSRNDDLNLRRSTRQKKVVTSKADSLPQPAIKNPNKNLRSGDLLSHESGDVVLKETSRQAKNSTKTNTKITAECSLNLKKNTESSKMQTIISIKELESKEVSDKNKYSKNDSRISTKNLKQGRDKDSDTNMETKETLVSSRQPKISVSPKDTNIKDPVKHKKLPCDKNAAIKLEKLTDPSQSKKVSPKESNVKKQKPELLKIKLPFKLKSPSEKPEESIIKERIECIPNIVIDQEIIEQDIPQIDGGNDTDDSDIESPKIKVKPNLQKLKIKSINQCVTKDHPKRLRKTVEYKEANSDDDFHTRDSSTSRNSDSPDKKTNIKPSSKSISKNISLRKLKTQRGKTYSQTSADSDKSKYFGTRVSGKLDVRNDIMNLVKQNLKDQKQVLRSKLAKHKRASRSYNSDSESDYIPKPTKKKASQDDFKEKTSNVKRRIPMKKDLIEMEKKRNAEKEENKKRKGINIWVEVFAEAEEKWISVDVVKGQVHCVKEIYTRATHPISYILSWDNGNHIKDITKRYCLNWNTVTRKLRVDSNWWDATLLPYKAPGNVTDREEDEDLARQQLEQPLPTSISEYKDHPLYALKRHILKFEALYPPDALILGFIRNEPVYSRDCIHVLHSREIWVKHAKVVKPGETPYKIVKARPKYDKLSNSVITDKPLEIFGKWQVEDYVPPTAENGIVPRNAYGNVELFKSCMLPKGTVHLQLPGLNKVAKKMNIDCAPAVVGFDFHGGWSHPTFDGYVVCEEYSEQLIAGWYTEQEESERRAQEKIEKRVYDNWRRLIKGLLIRERLKARYDFGEVSSKDSKTKKKGLTLKKRKIHSDSDSE